MANEGFRRLSEPLVKNFQREWFMACVKIGVGEKTGPEWDQYKGRSPRDFRRPAVRTLINTGVDQAAPMKITGIAR
jgi:hypothetical protein